MRARGLKQSSHPEKQFARMSRPMRARGLKHAPSGQPNRDSIVAPHAGAWIETPTLPMNQRVSMRRAPCGRVD